MIEIRLDHKQINADRIRSMSDEELAKFIEVTACPSHYTGMSCGFFICQSMNEILCNRIKDSDQDKNILEWLQKPVE